MVKTTIQLDESVRNKLRDRGRKSETYDDIILKLLAETEKKTTMLVQQEIR